MPNLISAAKSTFKRRTVREQYFAMALIALPVLFVALIILYPVVVSLVASFHDVRIVSGLRYKSPATFKNYVKMVESVKFWGSVARTFLYAGVVTIVSLVIGLGTAVLLNQKFRGRLTSRILFMLPWPLPASIAALIWMWLLDPTAGVFNFLLYKIGLINQPIAWLSYSATAFIAICLATIWKGYPFFTLMLLSGLQSIPGELYEAASMDGAGPWGRFTKITLPGLRSVITIACVLHGLWTFRSFAIIYVMTQGGPSSATSTMALMIYREAFEFFHMGYAATIGVAALFICLVGTVIMIRYGAEEFY
ncbi:MAG: sugar ABC transporter permease [Spirochaetales bacterium]|nr:sugar ABC transporter permease [Spirochaetales bacterium]